MRRRKHNILCSALSCSSEAVAEENCSPQPLMIRVGIATLLDVLAELVSCFSKLDSSGKPVTRIEGFDVFLDSLERKLRCAHEAPGPIRLSSG